MAYSILYMIFIKGNKNCHCSTVSSFFFNRTWVQKYKRSGKKILYDSFKLRRNHKTRYRSRVLARGELGTKTSQQRVSALPERPSPNSYNSPKITTIRWARHAD
jgi:hypothetical protein